MVVVIMSIIIIMDAPFDQALTKNHSEVIAGNLKTLKQHRSIINSQLFDTD